MAIFSCLTAPTANNEQDWVLEYARLPQVEWGVKGKIKLYNIRNFRYHPTRDDYLPDWYDVEIDLNQLKTVDVVSSYWSGKVIAHLFLSFGFADGRHLAISIETRRSRDQRYSTWRGFSKYYMLTYVLADERDLIGVRTDVRKERVYLYPIQISSDTAQALFMSYLQRIERLNCQPEFYHSLFNNCTTNILHHATSVSVDIHYNWKVLVSGFADKYIYDLGLIDNSLPFEWLKKRCLIKRPDNAVINESFSRFIREER